MTQREYWIEVVQKIIRPVLTNAAERVLTKNLIVESNGRDRQYFSNLEIIGRTLVGTAPWLENGEEPAAKEWGALARQALDGLTDAASPDYGNFTAKHGNQPVVDAAFLAHALLRAPRVLWMELDKRTRVNIIKALRQTRECRVHNNNWLLFAAMIETFFHHIGEPYDEMRVDHALTAHLDWYCGDGLYADGPEFHADYYNSFVIHPMLVDIIEKVGRLREDWAALRDRIFERARRYARIQEMLIAPDGTYPPVGRSITYRFGAFGALAHMALRRDLPKEVSPGQARCALSAVLRRVLQAPDMFTPKGWLSIGLYGCQPKLGEGYISTASLYLCTKMFLPLGLPASDPFWSAPDCRYTSQKIWAGKDISRDHALKDIQ